MDKEKRVAELRKKLEGLEKTYVAKKAELQGQLDILELRYRSDRGQITEELKMLTDNGCNAEYQLVRSRRLKRQSKRQIPDEVNGNANAQSKKQKQYEDSPGTASDTGISRKGHSNRIGNSGGETVVNAQQAHTASHSGSISEYSNNGGTIGTQLNLSGNSSSGSERLDIMN